MSPRAKGSRWRNWPNALPARGKMAWRPVDNCPNGSSVFVKVLRWPSTRQAVAAADRWRCSKACRRHRPSCSTIPRLDASGSSRWYQVFWHWLESRPSPAAAASTCLCRTSWMPSGGADKRSILARLCVRSPRHQSNAWGISTSRISIQRENVFNWQAGSTRWQHHPALTPGSTANRWTWAGCCGRRRAGRA